jgi:iron complex outermembrane receptor protein
MSIRFLRLVTALGAGYGLTLNVTTAQAQEVAAENGEVTLSEITVTARRVEENLMVVPASVTALSADTLEAANVKDMTDITNFQPSFHFVNQAGGASPIVSRASVNVNFRGLVEGGGSGSVFIDGAPVVDGQPPTLDEVARVEVLKGPQSAYFGRSTFAGAINYVTKDPSLTSFGGEISGEVSSFGSTDDYIGVDFPIVNDVLGVRVSGRHHIKGGEYPNGTGTLGAGTTGIATLPNSTLGSPGSTDQLLGEEGTNSLSTTILFQPNEKLRIKGWVNWIQENDGPEYEAGVNSGDGFYNLASPPGAVYKGGYITGPIPNAAAISPANISCNCTMTPFLAGILLGNSQNYHLIFDPSWQRSFGLKRDELQEELNINFEFLPGYNVSSLTAYHYDKEEAHWDIDNRAGYAVPNPFFSATSGPNVLPYYGFDLGGQSLDTDFSEEIRITSPQDRAFSWSFGGDYLIYKTPGSSLIGEIPSGPADFGGVTHSSTSTPAVFGGIRYTFLPKLTLSIEARYQWDNLFQHQIYVGNNLATGLAAQPLKGTFKSFSPRASLNYDFAPNSTAYVLFSRGYKPGGFNTAVLSNTAAQNAFISGQGGNPNLTFAQERLDNFEFGIKQTFLDGRARVAVSFYRDKWVDGQVPDNISVPANPLLPIGAGNTTRIESPVTNAGLIYLEGIEWEGDMQITSHLGFSSTFALNNTDVVHYETCSDCLQILGTTTAHGAVPNAPRIQGAGAFTYTDHLLADWNWDGRIDYLYVGRIFVDYTNLAWIQQSQHVNLHLGVSREKLRLEGFVTNLTHNSTPPSVDRIVNGFTFFGQNQTSLDYTLPDKQSFGVRASYRF